MHAIVQIVWQVLRVLDHMAVNAFYNACLVIEYKLYTVVKLCNRRTGYNMLATLRELLLWQKAACKLHSKGRRSRQTLSAVTCSSRLVSLQSPCCRGLGGSYQEIVTENNCPCHTVKGCKCLQAHSSGLILMPIDQGIWQSERQLSCTFAAEGKGCSHHALRGLVQHNCRCSLQPLPVQQAACAAGLCIATLHYSLYVPMQAV